MCLYLENFLQNTIIKTILFSMAVKCFDMSNMKQYDHNLAQNDGLYTFYDLIDL